MSERSLLADTIARAAALEGVQSADVLLLAGESFPLAALQEEAKAGGAPDATVIVEPAPRNTAPAAALAALFALERAPDSIVLLLPSDHHIGDRARFEAAVSDGAALAAQDYIVTFGIEPTSAHTGYGYIARGEPLTGGFRVDRFKEKPDAAAAQGLLDAGGHSWNSGIYMFRPRTYLDELERFEPQVRKQAELAWRAAKTERGVRRPDAGHWTNSPSISIDKAVSERTARAAVVPAAMEWSDIGSWDALWEIAAGKDAAGNVAHGDVEVHDARGSYVRSSGRLVALIGVKDLVVVDTGDAVIVAARGRSEEVKTIVERLAAKGRKDML